MSGGSRAVVAGGGPAGLMAAEALARAGLSVTVIDRMPTLGRKLLMAGKSGLNLTRMQDPAEFGAAYGAGAGPVPGIVAGFGAAELRAWAAGLGQETFAGSTGRVFPVAMKASPLLRAWLARLTGLGVAIRPRTAFAGFAPDGIGSGGIGTGGIGTGGIGSGGIASGGIASGGIASGGIASGGIASGGIEADGPDGREVLAATVTVLAMGGASWRRLGSDGGWARPLAAAGVPLVPFAPANAGLAVAWTAPMARLFGTPLKGVALAAGGAVSRGEVVISARGLEGGGIYAVGRAVREGAPLAMDLAPDLEAAALARRLAGGPGKASTATWLRKRLGFDAARIGLLNEWARPLPRGPELGGLIKALPVRHGGLGPLDAAISTAGGVAWAAVDETLMLRARPGVFVAGEMLDWEAPTGGYLLTACLATGRHAGRAAAAWAQAG